MTTPTWLLLLLFLIGLGYYTRKALADMQTPSPEVSSVGTKRTGSRTGMKIISAVTTLAVIWIIGNWIQSMVTVQLRSFPAPPPIHPTSDADLYGDPKTYSITVKSWYLRRENGMIVVRGEIKNTCSEPLYSPQAVATFYGSGNTFITSADSYVRSNPLSPGKTAPFAIFMIDDPAVKSARLKFLTVRGKEIQVSK